MEKNQLIWIALCEQKKKDRSSLLKQMDDDIFIPEDTRSFEPLNKFDSNIWNVITTYIWGKNYVPLDDHDWAAIYKLAMMLLTLCLVVIITCYKFIESNKKSVDQRQRIKIALTKHKQKKGNGHSQ